MASLPLAPGEDRSAPARLLSLNVGMPRDAQWQGLPDRVLSLLAGAAGPRRLRLRSVRLRAPDGDAAPPAPHPPPGDPGAGELVSFARSNLAIPWDPSFGSLLEFAEACDVPVRWSCRTGGVCHSCQTGLVSGGLDYGTEPLEPAEPGTALICCSTPSGELILDL